jgi:hypothetical protein
VKKNNRKINYKNKILIKKRKIELLYYKMYTRGGNRLLELEELKRNHLRHIQHLQTAKPKVDDRLSDFYVTLASERSSL